MESINTNLSFTRAQITKRPDKETIKATVKLANERYKSGEGRMFFPEPYTR